MVYTPPPAYLSHGEPSDVFQSSDPLDLEEADVIPAVLNNNKKRTMSFGVEIGANHLLNDEEVELGDQDTDEEDEEEGEEEEEEEEGEEEEEVEEVDELQLPEQDEDELEGGDDSGMSSNLLIPECNRVEGLIW